MTKRLLMLLIVLPAMSVASPWQDQQSSHMKQSSPAWVDLMASMDKMDAAMGSITATGNDDADFVRLMLPHHQAALDMARTELLHGRDPQMRRLAQEIITDQQSEIDLMRLWLNQRQSALSQTPASSTNAK